MTKASLTAEEKKRLEAFRFLTERPEVKELTSAKRLMNPQGLEAFLHDYSGRIGSADKKVLSSLLFKRYAFLAVISLFSFSAFNKKLNVSPENVFLADGEKNGLWLPGFYFEDQAAQPVVEEREKVRKEVAVEVFRNHLFPLMKTVKKVSGLSTMIAWENVAVYMFWIYEGLIEEKELQHVRARMEGDFKWLLDEGNAELFGSSRRNPLARYYSKKQYVAEQDSELRVRKTCCFSYQLTDGEGSRCKTCPQTCNVKQLKGVTK
ncbi:IucA/IucC family C-terminal-domain containing protein [Bacillus sp. SCS-153A]|uniref:IucA/IucC family C-terminal-domain containing protein n=1 Tax=Rossellomorea sedimentorum TaxID=3115294 RepID=UPI003906CDBC